MKEDFDELLNEYILENKDKYGEDLQRMFKPSPLQEARIELEEYERTGKGEFLVPGEVLEKVQRMMKTHEEEEQ